MKLYVTLLLVLATREMNGQNLLVPDAQAIDKKWLRSNSYQMDMYAVDGEKEQELGRLMTRVLCGNEYVIVVNQVRIKNVDAVWVDSSIASLATMAPIRHSSHNMQRDIVLNFGNAVTGQFVDKVRKTTAVINDKPKSKFFDSNIYPVLLGCLPFEDGYRREIAIYDYAPDANSGVMKATVKEVSSGNYQTKKSGTRDVWIVKVVDEIGNGRNGVMTYYFDKEDRRLWKQEMNASGRKLMARRAE